MDEDRIFASKELGEDNIQKSLRPKTFNEYIGQEDLKQKMNIFIKAAKIRKESRLISDNKNPTNTYFAK